jgi:excisionase family DNA binding protein
MLMLEKWICSGLPNLDLQEWSRTMPEALLSVEQLAEYLGVPVGTVYRWNHVGTGPKPIHVGRHVRYRPQAVDVWLDARSERTN